MLKHYNSDPVKAKSRVVVRGLLERTLMRGKDASQVKVVCLPGVDAQEILEVYDSLNIPRQNITGLEIDPEIASEIQKKNLGINVIHTSAEKYFGDKKSHDYDVVSLDFTGTATQETLRMLKNISTKQTNPNFFLHIAHSMCRDSQLLYFLRSVNILEGLIKNRPDLASAALPVDEHEIKEIRDTHYTQFIIDGLADSDLLGIRAGSFLFGKDLYEKILDRSYDKFVTEARTESQSLGFSDELRRVRGERLKKLLASKAPNFPVELSEGIEAILFRHALSEKSNYYQMSEIAKYSYISESGTPMNGDAIFLKRNPACDKAIADLVHSIGYPKNFHIQNFRKFIQAFQKLQAVGDSYLNEQKIFDRARHTPREYLGSATKPVLTKSKFRDEIEAGKDLNYIRTNYRGTENKPLDLWQSEINGKSTTELAEDSNIERITKNQAIEMLVSGIPASEIYASYPTSFTEGQLRAFKAHITMNTYQTQGAA